MNYYLGRPLNHMGRSCDKRTNQCSLEMYASPFRPVEHPYCYAPTMGGITHLKLFEIRLS